MVRIGLAALRFPRDPNHAVELALGGIQTAAAAGARIVCYPEAFVPGYRIIGREALPPDRAFLERAWTTVSEAAARHRVGVVLGTERIVDGRLRISSLVLDERGNRLGFQDKVQLDPSEEGRYQAGSERAVFQVGPLRFGISICHEGWRYPETVRWPARRGAHLVFHPHFHEAEPGAYRPVTFADPANTFHEKAVLCRAAENGCYVATVNYASEGAPTASAVARPDGTLLCHQPYGVEGVLIADLDLGSATGLLASRYRPLD